MIFQENIKTINQFQNSCIKKSNEISNNYMELLKNMINMYQLDTSQILKNLEKTYFNNFMIPEIYKDQYNIMTQNISDRIANSVKLVNNLILGNIEMFNKSVEITQKFYKDSTQNYFNYVRNIEKSFNQ